MSLNVVVGPPCGGKSTFVSEHASSGELIVDYDAIATALGSDRSHQAEGLVREAAFAARDAVIAKAMKASGETSWIIHTSPTEKKLAAYQEAGAVFHLCDPGRDIALARVDSDNRPEATRPQIDKWYQNQPGGGWASYLSKELTTMPKDAGIETAKVDDVTANAATGTNTDAAEQPGDPELTSEAFAAAIARAEAAEAKVAALELRDQKNAWAAEIVKDSPVPPEALRGDTKEELQDHFNILAALVKPAVASTIPLPRSTPPGKPVSGPAKLSAAAAVRALRPWRTATTSR